MPTRIDGPVAVIGDIHGQVEKLLTILEKLRATPDYENRWIVFIGDFVDRGPDPKATLDIVNDLIIQHPKTTAIAGNHELAMSASLGLVPVPEYSDWGTRWVANYGAEPTFSSYGVEHGDLEDLANRLPEKHGEFLANLPWHVQHPKYLFVHAGLDPHIPFQTQLKILQEKDFTLGRPQWLCSKTLVHSDPPSDCSATVVSGHVRVPQVEFRSKRILLDTTGGVTGDLSCVLLPEKRVISSGSDQPAKQSSKAWWKLWRK